MLNFSALYPEISIALFPKLMLVLVITMFLFLFNFTAVSELGPCTGVVFYV